MSIDSTWLRCPNCFRRLEHVEPHVLGCDDGHRFDVSKYGTVTLLPPRAPHTIGDSRAMLTARAELLGSGAFDPIADALVEACRSNGSALGGMRIADLGCGTGFYSKRLAQEIPGARILLADRSPDAVRMARRAMPEATTGVVLDLWRPLPIRDAVADLCLNVFAPRNPEEFARITRPGGSLVVVVPTDRHLAELRSRGGMLDIPSGKADRVTTQFVAAGFVPETVHRVERAVPLDSTAIAALVAMGPSAHHLTDGDLDADVSPRSDALGADEPASRPPSDALPEVTVSVDVLRFHRS